MIDSILIYWGRAFTGELSVADYCGWLGTIGLFAFYFLLGKKKVMQAYIASIIAGVLWTAVGILLSIPSLVFMEIVIILLNLRGIHNWWREGR